MDPKIEDSNRFGLLTENELAAFEVCVGGRLPEDYRKYLLIHNGGTPHPNTFTISEDEGDTSVHILYGLHAGPSWASLKRSVEVYRGRIPSEAIPIGSDPLGNAILLVFQGPRMGEICFWDHEQEGGPSDWDNVVTVAPSFSKFLGLLKEFDPPEDLKDDEVSRIIGEGDLAKLTELLEAGLSVNTKDKFGHKLADVAAVKDRSDVLKLLIERGADLSGTLGIAAQNGHVDCVRMLLSSGVEVNERFGSMGSTALINAASFGFDETVRELLSKGADVHALDSKGRSALQLAGWGEHRNIIHMLKAAGA
jgi:hypothetical protein